MGCCGSKEVGHGYSNVSTEPVDLDSIMLEGKDKGKHQGTDQGKNKAQGTGKARPRPAQPRKDLD